MKMLHRIIWMGLLAGAASGAGCRADPGPQKQDPVASASQAIEGGQLETGFSAVGGVFLPGTSFCTGALITPYYVLTAAHCMAPVMNFETVNSQGDRGPSNYLRMPVKTHPSLDLLIGELEFPVYDVPLLQINDGAPPAVGEMCKAVGIGDHDDGTDLYAKHSAVEQVYAVGPMQIDVERVTGISDKGDSGGPLVCGTQIAAVASQGVDGNGPQHTKSAYAPVDAAWIAQNTVPDLNPSCSAAVDCVGSTADVFFNCAQSTSTLVLSQQNADGTWTVLSTLAAGTPSPEFFLARPIGGAFNYKICEQIMGQSGCVPLTVSVTCGWTSCVPTSCSELGACGTISDGCFNTLSCGGCPAGNACDSNTCAPCTPTTCAAAGATCGSVSDGCGGTLQCGSCPGGEACAANHCAACTPTTCAAQGAACGSLADGCGNTLSCGTCPGTQVCSANHCCPPGQTWDAGSEMCIGRVVKPPPCRGVCQ